MRVNDDRCQAETTKRKSALFQPVRGTRGRPDLVRYERCKNKATETVEVERLFMRSSQVVKRRVCKTHKRMHEEGRYLP